MNRIVNDRIILFPVTKWHYYGMLAFLISKYGKEQLLKMRIEVYAVKHSESGYLITINDMIYPNVIYKTEDDIDINSSFVFKLPILLSPFRKSKDSNIILMSANNILVRKYLSVLTLHELKKCYLQTVLVDDGIGSYFNRIVFDKCAQAESRHYYKDILISRVSSMLQKHLNCLNWHMLGIDANGLVPINTNFYCDVISDAVNEEFSDQLEVFLCEHPNRLMMIITQPWSETKQIDRETEMRIIKEVVSSNKDDYQVIIKPHPRENINKYDEIGVEILRGNLPAEFYFTALRSNDIVVGFNSTSLISAKFIFDLDTYTIAKRLDLGSRDNMMDIACRQFLDITNKTIKDF